MSTRRTTIVPFLLVVGLASVAAQDAPQPPARPPAPTLSRPATAVASPDAAGFLRRWLLLEPVRVPGALTDSAVRSAVTAHALALPPAAVPLDGDVVTDGEARLTWHAVDSSRYNVNLYHFAYALNRPTSNVLFWVTTVVRVKQDTTVRLAIGSNAASVWWLNGEELVSLFNDRQAVIDDGVSKRVRLRAGPNVIRAAIINAGGATDFCARFLDDTDRPVTTVLVDLPSGRR